MDFLEIIWGVLESIFNLLKTGLDFLLNLVSDLTRVLQSLTLTVLHLPDYLSMFLPTAFVSLLVVIFSFVIIYKVLGREG